MDGGTGEDLGWGQAQGGAGTESLSHLVSEVSRPFPSLLPVDPSQPLLSPINEFSALPSPSPPSSPAPQFGSGALTWLGSSSGEGPSPQPIPSAESWGDEQEGVSGGGATGAERGQGPRGRVGLTWLLRLQAPSNS